MLPYQRGSGRPPSNTLVRTMRDTAIAEGEEALQNIIHEAMAPDVPEAQGAPLGAQAVDSATQMQEQEQKPK